MAKSGGNTDVWFQVLNEVPMQPCSSIWVCLFFQACNRPLSWERWTMLATRYLEHRFFPFLQRFTSLHEKQAGRTIGMILVD